MSRNLRSAIYGYGLAVLLFAAVVSVALLLQKAGIKVNFTIPVVVGLVVASWFGGRGPGVFFAILVTATTVAFNPLPADTSIATYIVAMLSVLCILLLIVVLISGKRMAEMRLREQSAALRHQSDRLAITLASIGDGVISTDKDGIVTFINPTAERLTGCLAADANGKKLSDLYNIVDELTGEPIDDIFNRIRSTRAQVELPGVVDLISCDGRKIPISDIGAPIIDPSGAFIGAVIVFQDVTAKREAERALLEGEARIQQSQKLEAIGTLTGGIAHDFNNLLQAILGYSQLSLTQVAVGDRVHNNLVTIESAATRGAELTQKLLAFAKRQRLDRKVTDLNDCISEILKLLERVIGEDIKVSFIPATDLKPVMADRAQIEQVIMNLSVNARDAMPRGGRLTIETRNIEIDDHYCRQNPTFQPGSYVQILVSDTGVGMEKETLLHIFEPFFTTKEVNKGTGLGLSMVYGIIEQHGGHLNVYSEPGKGTTFKIFLPIHASETVAEQIVAKPTPVGGTETILVAEDEESLRALAEDALRALGYNVITAENGQAAVEIYGERKHEIDLLLFDVVMPVMGGAEAYRQIRDAGGSQQVIFMTGYTSDILDGSLGLPTDAAEQTEAAVIQKPYTLDTLGRTVRETLDKQIAS